jgi:DNA polymerase
MSAPQRKNLWLKSERAMGLESVRMPAPGAFPSPEPATAPVAISAPAALPQQLGITQLAAEILPRPRKISALSVLDNEQVKPCQRCRLGKSRKNTVFGEGDPDSSIFFIGEGPGENEDLQGRPFVGRAGELLNKMIGGMGLKREQVYIANIVKCRPPDNRVPAPDEVETCTPYLVRQLEIIRPKVIVTLGLSATKYMLDTRLSMGKMRGQWHNWRGIKLMPTYHPAFLLRAYTEENRQAVWSDLKQVMAEVGLKLPARP